MKMRLALQILRNLSNTCVVGLFVRSRFISLQRADEILLTQKLHILNVTFFVYFSFASPFRSKLKMNLRCILI